MKYVLRAFVRVTESDVEYISKPHFIEFRPHIDPSIATRATENADEMSNSLVKDGSGRVLAEAKLPCSGTIGTIFGSNCPLNLIFLIRQSESKPLPRKAKIDIYEIHKSTVGKKGQCFMLSRETVALPVDSLESHRECRIVLHT